MGRRITRKQLKQKDDFVTIADSVFGWFNENWRPIVAVAGAALFVYLIWGLASWWSQDRAIEASVKLAEAIKAVEKIEENEDIATESAEELLAEVIDEHGRTIQGDMARLHLAKILLDREENDEARALLVRLVEKHRGNTIGRLAAYDLLHLRIASGQAAEVTMELEAMVAGQDNRLPRDMALYELAMIHLKERNRDKAKEYLGMLIEEFPESGYRQPASQKLSELG
jgi:predicted negative regulator of RcsB-dependent stress response